MKKTHSRVTLSLRAETIRTLSADRVVLVRGGYQEDSPSGSQYGSGPCPPPKNGEGSGCLTH